MNGLLHLCNIKFELIHLVNWLNDITIGEQCKMHAQQSNPSKFSESSFSSCTEAQFICVPNEIRLAAIRIQIPKIYKKI